MSHPTGPQDEGWFEWAEAETVSRLRRQLAERRAIQTPPPEPIVLEADSLVLEPEPQEELRFAEMPARVIRVHGENVSTA